MQTPMSFEDLCKEESECNDYVTCESIYDYLMPFIKERDEEIDSLKTEICTALIECAEEGIRIRQLEEKLKDKFGQDKH